jgi:hypothetical protein
MQGACKTMENIISQLDRSKSEHNHRLSNHSPVLNNEFQFGGLTVESFSTDHSDQSRFGSLHLPSEVSFSNKVGNFLVVDSVFNSVCCFKLPHMHETAINSFT